MILNGFYVFSRLVNKRIEWHGNRKCKISCLLFSFVRKLGGHRFYKLDSLFKNQEARSCRPSGRDQVKWHSGNHVGVELVRTRGRKMRKKCQRLSEDTCRLVQSRARVRTFPRLLLRWCSLQTCELERKNIASHEAGCQIGVCHFRQLSRMQKIARFVIKLRKKPWNW